MKKKKFLWDLKKKKNNNNQKIKQKILENESDILKEGIYKNEDYYKDIEKFVKINEDL